MSQSQSQFVPRDVSQSLKLPNVPSMERELG